VSIEVTLECSGHDPSIHGALKVLGGKASAPCTLSAPLPTAYTTTVPLENLWCQQLLVRFCRSRTVLIESAKKHKKKKAK